MTSTSAIYTDTSTKLASDAGTTARTVNVYARLALLDFVLASNGTKLFRRGQAETVRAIRAERLSRRGGRHEKRRVA